MNDDDRMMPTIEMFIGKRVIVSIKMDGKIHLCIETRFVLLARSIRKIIHPEIGLNNSGQQFSHDIPEEWRIVGENMFAEHSIFLKI